MATASQLIAEVRRIIRDDSYSAEAILGFLNQGILEVAGWDNDNPAFGLVGNILLPALESSATAATSTITDHVALPATYLKDLYAVTFPGQTRKVEVLSNMRVFLESWDYDLTREGPVEEVVVHGLDLYYQPIPATATILTLYFHAKPTLLVNYDPSGDDTDDTPSCIPDQFHRSLLVNYAAKEIFNEIEDGIDGQKANFPIYEGRFQAALAKLHASIRHKSKQVPLVRRSAQFF